MKTLESFFSFKKRYVVLIFFLFCCALSFSQTRDTINLEYSSKEQDLKSAKALVHSYETGDWEKLRSLLQPDATFYNLGSFDSLSVDQTIAYWTKGRETATPKLADDATWLPVSILEGSRKGNWVLHWGRNTLTYPKAETIEFPYHLALKFRDSKVSEAHFYYDNNKILRALGYGIDPPILEGIKEDKENDKE